ncbi:MAG: helix-turn-helix transcriptional regulator, partial [Clostridia bacterium]|nr:helix-turn-helix transcriptional regulator [Clostridia bacterium]
MLNIRTFFEVNIQTSLLKEIFMEQGNMVPLNQHIGNRIRFYRTRRNMSQEQLAMKIFKSKSTLSKYESGK